MKSYLNLLRDVLENGEAHDDRTGVGTRSVFGRQWRHDMRDGFPLLTTKRVPLRWVFEELRWFLSGSTNAKDLQAAGVDIWDEWATSEQCEKFGRAEGDLGPVYGGLWRRFPIGRFDGSDDDVEVGDTDQIAGILSELESNPRSRRIICSGWHPHYQSQVALPPCHTLWQLKVHPDDSLSLHLYARSIDIFLGLPFNIASYGLLLELIGCVTERRTRDLIISFGDLHLYSNHVDQAREQLTREPNPLPLIYPSTDFPQRGEFPNHETPMDALLAVRWDHIQLTSYDHHPAIKAEVAV
ncbi:MAG: thymidylate synthase [Novipirellula sp. JB048]